MLVLLLGYPSHRASGTSLVALLLPVGALGAWTYDRAGKIGPEDIQGGLLIAVGLVPGAFVGAKFAVQLPETLLRKGFSILLLVIALKL